MDEATRLGFELAKEVATQLIALSTGLLTLTITFTKEIFRASPKHGRVLLPFAWAAQVLSIGFGVLHLMALTGTLMPVDPATRSLQFGGTIRFVAGGQIIAFGVGTLFLFVYGLLSFGTRERAESDRRAAVVSINDAEAFFNAQVSGEWDVLNVVPGSGDRFIVTLQKRARQT